RLDALVRRVPKTGSRTIGSRGQSVPATPPSTHSLEKIHQFHNLLPLLTDRSCLESVVDTFPGMDSKKLGLCLFQCRLHGLDLLQDVNAIPILIQHAAESSHLALDTAQPPCDCVAGLFAIGHSCSCS